MLFQHETDELLVGNIGDSRAVLCRGGLAVDLSLDHKPEDETELDRIKKAGGYLTGKSEHVVEFENDKNYLL